jgi:hypothetical protein
MKQQTAVDWLKETMLKPLSQWPDDIWDQAKEMEKEKMIEFTDNFWFHCVNRDGSIKITPEQYYNETYGGNK